MTLDDAERFARWTVSPDPATYPGDVMKRTTIKDLAELVLTLLPVVRAAIAYRDAKDFDTYEATALEEAVDHLRSRLGEE